MNRSRSPPTRPPTRVLVPIDEEDMGTTIRKREAITEASERGESIAISSRFLPSDAFPRYNSNKENLVGHDQPLNRETTRMNKSRNPPTRLPVPIEGEDMGTTIRKLEVIAEASEQGEIIALATGLQLVPNELRQGRRGSHHDTDADAERLARTNMTPSEGMMYDAWKQNISTNRTFMQPFDWKNNKAPIPNGKNSLKKFADRAAVMDVIWQHQGISTPENAAWLTVNMVEAMPLVNAVQRVMKAEKHMKSQTQTHSQGDLWKELGAISEEEVWEIFTLQEIRAISDRNMERFGRKYRWIWDRLGMVN